MEEPFRNIVFSQIRVEMSTGTACTIGIFESALDRGQTDDEQFRMLMENGFVPGFSVLVRCWRDVERCIKYFDYKEEIPKCQKN